MNMTWLLLIIIAVLTAATAYTIYRYRPQHDEPAPQPRPTSVWEDTVTALGHPDDIDTTLPDFHWPPQPAGKT